MSSVEEPSDDLLRGAYHDDEVDAALIKIDEAVSIFRKQHPDHLDLGEAEDLAEFCATAVNTLRNFRGDIFAKTKGELGKGDVKLLNPGDVGPKALLEVLEGVVSYVVARNRSEKDRRIAEAGIKFQQLLRFGQAVEVAKAVSVDECALK